MSVSRISTIAARATRAIGSFAMLSVAAAGIVHTQSAGSGGAQQVAALQQQLTALDRRVKELEKSASGASGSDDTTAEGRIKALEAKVRSLESAVEARGPGTDLAGQLAGKRVTAPFTVVDRAGKVLMKITEAGDGLSRGAYMFDGAEKIVAYIGGDATGGRVYVTRAGALPRAMIYADDKTGLALRAATGKPGTVIDESALTFLSDAGVALSSFGTKDRAKGYLELNDGNGTKMVEAGMLDSRKGYVMATPYRASVSPNGNPSVLMGGAGR